MTPQNVCNAKKKIGIHLEMSIFFVDCIPVERVQKRTTQAANCTCFVLVYCKMSKILAYFKKMLYLCTRNRNSVSSAYLHVQYKILQGKFPKSQKKYNIWGKSQSVSCIFQKNVVTLHPK